MANLKNWTKSLFTKEKTVATPIVQEPIGEPKSQSLPSFRLYSSTKDISCHLFWTTIIDGVLSRLIYEGELTKEQKESDAVKAQLAAAWQDILIEHAETINDDAVFSHQQIVDTEKKAAMINWVATAVLYLQKEYHKELTDELRKRFITSGVQLDIANPFQFQKDLDRCLAVSATWKFELTQQQNVINERFESSGKKGELTYKAFAKTLVPMAQFMGGKPLNARELTVYDYDLIYCDMVERASKENK